MASRVLWGEMEPPGGEETLFQNVDFSQMIELTMHQIPDIPSTDKTTVVEFPVDDIVKHTITLHDYWRQLTAILEQTESAIAEGTPVEASSVPPPPQPTPKLDHHKYRMPIDTHNDDDDRDFILGKGPVVQPLKPEDHVRALRQCASLALAHIGVYASTRTTINVLADALHHHLSTMTRLMRTIADREASGLSSGFADIVSKTFAEMRIFNLRDFYRNRILQYRDKVRGECTTLSNTISDTLQTPTQQFKLEDVPELHFPAALSEVFTPSLEPGFQMLHSLEQEELQGLELLETVTDDMKIEVVEYAHAPQSDTSPSHSPRNKKKRK